MPWPRDDAWFAGFAAGEGYFQLRLTENHGQRIEPRFRIHLRGDDGAVLRDLAAAFGGGVRVGKNGPWAPQVHWNVCSKRDLQRIVDYFDRFPLHAKKAREYAVWREAVLIFIPNSGVHPRLFELAEELLAVRVFMEDAA